MRHPRRGDHFVAQLRGRLPGPVYRSLIVALGGEPQVIPVGDAIAGISRAQLQVSPVAIVLDSKLAPTTDCTIAVVAPDGPSVEGPPVTIAIYIEPDDPAERPITEVREWPMGIATPDPYLLRIDVPGTRRVRCDITQDGLLIAQLTSEITVEETHRSGDPTKESAEDLVGALVIPESDLQAHYKQRTDRLATEAFALPGDQQKLADERAQFEFAAAQRGVTLERDLDPGADAIEVDGIKLSADPIFLRNLVEETYATGGSKAVSALEAKISSDLDRGDPNDADDPMAWSGPRQPILDGFRFQQARVEQELAPFIAGFAALAKTEAITHLEASKTKVEEELKRYGLPFGLSPDPNNVDIAELATSPEAEVMGTTAGELAANQRELDALRRQLADVEVSYLARVGSEDGSPMYDPLPDRTGEEVEILLTTLRRMSDEAEVAHTQKILEAIEKYPLIASCKKPDTAPVFGDAHTHSNIDAKALDKLVDAGSRTDFMISRGTEVTNNAQRTIDALNGGDLEIWKEPRIVQMAKAASLVVPGSVRDRAVADKVAEENAMKWTDWAKLAVTFALVAITFIPTGGGSAVAVGVVVTAEVGLAVIGVSQALESIKKYQIGMAAADTDFDKAKAIAADEPSMFWLALDVVGAVLDLGSAMKAFTTLSKARRAARAGMKAADLDEVLAVVHAEANQGRVTAEGALKLEDEIRTAAGLADEAADGAVDIARAAETDVAKAGKTAGKTDAKLAAGTDLRPRVRADDVAALEKQLGTKVVFDEGLDDGVSVIGKVADNGDIHVTEIRVGTKAVLADVLAHQRTIARVTRYNGLTGKLRKMWDRLVAMVGGKLDVNPFPKGSLGYNSFEEIQKLQGLIEQRRAKLVADVVDPSILDEEIQFLEGEVAKHQDVVRGVEAMEMSPAGILVERPKTGQRTAEAVAGGYPLPTVHPEHYYYRLSDTRPDVYELAIKPTAPKDLKLKSWHAEVVLENGIPKATGKLLEGRPQRIATVFDKLATDADVIAHVRKMDGFADFAGSLEKSGLYKPEEIDAVIAGLRKSGDDITDEVLRSKAKEIFRKDKVVPYLLDPNLTQIESFKRMDALLSPMGVADRGNLTELWYQARFAKKSEHHVATAVKRIEDGAEVLEDRVIDFVEGSVAKEVKSGAGVVAKDQFEAYLDMVQSKVKVGKRSTEITHVTYVFTDTVGANKNLPWIAEQVRSRGLKYVTVEAFDPAGRRYVLDTVEKMDDFVAKFGS
ncbi:MAG: hypothetical protein ABI867_24345 [Kofleriaceae bacterium]